MSYDSRTNTLRGFDHLMLLLAPYTNGVVEVDHADGIERHWVDDLTYHYNECEFGCIDMTLGPGFTLGSEDVWEPTGRKAFRISPQKPGFDWDDDGVMLVRFQDESTERTFRFYPNDHSAIGSIPTYLSERQFVTPRVQYLSFGELAGQLTHDMKFGMESFHTVLSRSDAFSEINRRGPEMLPHIARYLRSIADDEEKGHFEVHTAFGQLAYRIADVHEIDFPESVQLSDIDGIIAWCEDNALAAASQFATEILNLLVDSVDYDLRTVEIKLVQEEDELMACFVKGGEVMLLLITSPSYRNTIRTQIKGYMECVLGMDRPERLSFQSGTTT